MRGKHYRIKGDSPYFKDKYGTSNPIIKIEGKDTDLWVGGWKTTPNPVCYAYAIRVAEEHLPLPGIVYYGHIGNSGELVHETELGEEVTEDFAELLGPMPEPAPAGARG
jgi:hypothetical protein